MHNCYKIHVKQVIDKRQRGLTTKVIYLQKNISVSSAFIYRWAPIYKYT